MGGRGKRVVSLRPAGTKETLSQKPNRTGGVAQVVEGLPSMPDSLGSICNTQNNPPPPSPPPLFKRSMVLLPPIEFRFGYILGFVAFKCNSGVSSCLGPIWFYFSTIFLLRFAHAGKKKKALRNDETMFLALPLSIFDTSLIFYWSGGLVKLRLFVQEGLGLFCPSRLLGLCR
jgi:hypothetical protein